MARGAGEGSRGINDLGMQEPASRRFTRLIPSWEWAAPVCRAVRLLLRLCSKRERRQRAAEAPGPVVPKTRDPPPQPSLTPPQPASFPCFSFFHLSLPYAASLTFLYWPLFCALLLPPVISHLVLCPPSPPARLLTSPNHLLHYGHTIDLSVAVCPHPAGAPLPPHTHTHTPLPRLLPGVLCVL